MSPAKIISIFAAVVIGVSGGLYMNYRHSYDEVLIDLPSDTTASIYPDLGGDAPFQYDASKPALFKLSGDQTIRLKQGVYDIVANDPNKILKVAVQKFSVQPGTKKISFSPAYTDEKLASMLRIESYNIVPVLNAQLPGLPGYAIDKQQLLGVGDWWVAALRPNDPTLDRLKIILHKNNDKWEIAAMPSISIGQPSHPQIPTDVLKAADDL